MIMVGCLRAGEACHDEVMKQDPPDRPALPGVRIRAAADSDGPALAAIDQPTWSADVSPVPLWPFDRPFFDDRTPPENVLVAHEGERVIGYVKLRPDPLPASSGHVQEINGFAVAPGHQGRGVGRMLLDAARQEATSRGARRITLRVLGTNTRAQSLYRACGYQTEGVLKDQFYLEGRYVDDVFMALEIPVRG
jgi:ribosomal protein S18 acetylase RimI-like enzyme